MKVYRIYTEENGYEYIPSDDYDLYDDDDSSREDRFKEDLGYEEIEVE